MYGESTIVKGQLQNETSVKTANVGSVKLTEYNIYPGVVKHVDYVSKRLTVLVDENILQNCVYAANTLSALLGFSSTQLPSVGSRVICFYCGDITWVIGTQPNQVRNIAQYAGDITGISEYSQAGDKNIATKHSKNIPVNAGYPTSRDLLPGEEEFTNNLGVALRLLTNFAQLDAGGIAKIECHLYNDMVRIVDNYYAHHHCGGDTFIWNNGRNNYESHFTSYPHEAAGKLTPDDPYAEVYKPLEKQNVFQLPEDVSKISGAGRWRKSTYLGFLGDMLHFWVTHPVDVISNYAQESARASRFKTWVGSDGTLMVQAAGDVVIDVTQHMVIPEVHFKWDDPSYNPEEVLKQLDLEYLKIWGKGKEHWKDMKVACWQMRNYLKYITVWHSLQRFRQLANVKEGEPYCTIKSELENPVGDVNCGEEDKFQANGQPDGPAQSGTCLLHMCPDGSITLLSGNSLSCVMNNGNLQLVAPYNIEIKAGDTFSVTAKDVSIKAHRNIELVSLAGSLFIKARTAIKALCEAGRIWLKGDAPNTDTPTDLDYPQQVEFNKYSIVLDASQGELLAYGKKGITIGTDGEGSRINIQSTGAKGNIELMAKQNITQYSNIQVIKTTAMNINAQNTRWYGSSLTIFDTVELNKKGIDINGTLRSTFIRTPNMLYAQSYKALRNKEVATTKPEDYEEQQESATPVVTQDKPTEDFIQSIKPKDISQDYNKEEFKNGKEKWCLFEWKVDNENVLMSSSLKADPWADTFINCPNISGTWRKSYLTVNWDNVQHLYLKKAPRTETKTMPWPGIGAKFFVFDKTTKDPVPVSEAWSEDFKEDDIGKLSDMKAKPLIYYFLTKENREDEK